jgi:hypothetical protein
VQKGEAKGVVDLRRRVIWIFRSMSRLVEERAKEGYQRKETDGLDLFWNLVVI